MYTAGESVFYRRSDGSLVPATVLGPGAQSETVQIEYKRNERLVRHPAALIANLSRPIPTIPDSPEWDSAPSRSPSPPPRTRPMERSAKRRPRHSAPPSVRPVQIQPEITNFFSAAPVQKQTEITNFFGPNASLPTSSSSAQDTAPTIVVRAEPAVRKRKRSRAETDRAPKRVHYDVRRKLRCLSYADKHGPREAARIYKVGSHGSVPTSTVALEIADISGSEAAMRLACLKQFRSMQKRMKERCYIL
mmetsp:Transcript_78277/g.130647  ORF Transcript_78277/g.130647 Transcript_78277/m.130647 type:complete len:248 (-) Transcript_78277:103-846(-)